MTSQTKLSTWKRLLIDTKEYDVLNFYIDNLKKASNYSVSFAKFFGVVSKNEGVSFLILDPTETHLQILHHGHMLGGNWSNPTNKMVAILGTDSDAKPIQIISKTIKNIKEKSLDLNDFELSLEREEEFVIMEGCHSDFAYKNILPIPHLLSKILI